MPKYQVKMSDGEEREISADVMNIDTSGTLILENDRGWAIVAFAAGVWSSVEKLVEDEESAS